MNSPSNSKSLRAAELAQEAASGRPIGVARGPMCVVALIGAFLLGALTERQFCRDRVDTVSSRISPSGASLTGADGLVESGAVPRAVRIGEIRNRIRKQQEVVTELDRQRKENLIMVHLMNHEPGSSSDWDQDLLVMRGDELDRAFEDAATVLEELMLIHARIEASRDVTDINGIHPPMDSEADEAWRKALEDRPALDLVPYSRAKIRWAEDS